MTLEEAKQFYFSYLGHSFHMDREEPAKANSFRMLNIDRETLRQWDEELLEGLFRDFRSRPGQAWIPHGRILEVLRRGYCDAAPWLSRLLDEMEQTDRFDMKETTLIIENMAGRTESMKDGGVCIFCKHPETVARMKDIMERLIEAKPAESAETAVGDRFEKAVRSYRKALVKSGTGA